MFNVTILMATYNGEHFIREQLDSLLKQTHTNWNLYVRDDGSTDKTLEIISNYVQQDSRISLIDFKWATKGACGNFGALYSWAKANADLSYIMFCDQDDIWHPDKIEITYKAMNALELKNPKTACLIYGQLEFIDEFGQSLPGRIKMVENHEFRYLLSYNYMYGCTMMLNKPLIDNLENIPDEAENHDYWVALVASLGVVGFINKPLLSYRRHFANVSGNVKNNSSFKQRIIRHTLNASRLIYDMQKRIGMLSVFYNVYYYQLDVNARYMLKEYLHSFSVSRLAVARKMLRHKILRNSILQTAGSFFILLSFYRHIINNLNIPINLYHEKEDKYIS